MTTPLTGAQARQLLSRPLATPDAVDAVTFTPNWGSACDQSAVSGLSYFVFILEYGNGTHSGSPGDGGSDLRSEELEVGS